MPEVNFSVKVVDKNKCKRCEKEWPITVHRKSTLRIARSPDVYRSLPKFHWYSLQDTQTSSEVLKDF